MPINGSKASPDRMAIARDQARARIGVAYRAHLARLGKAGAADFVASVIDANWEAAITAEVVTKGSGWQALRDAMFDRWAAATGPPSTVARATAIG